MITSQIERKSYPQPEAKDEKILDKQLLKNKVFNRKITISNWKEIVSNKKLSEDEKNEKINMFLKMA